MEMETETRWIAAGIAGWAIVLGIAIGIWVAKVKEG